ncbi:hypothetical protein [Nocardioides sp.]|uniref:hypothetical protein n=1 Tax=Nocardioides sp. TaxID=35761 RepID=UPI00261A705F|nr:hypothetical protein [Nocardioides sp.]
MSTPTPPPGPQGARRRAPQPASDVVAVSVHGPAGVLDLLVPAGASGGDVAAEYSRQARLPSAPRLYTRLGHELSADISLEDAGIGAGAVLVASGAPDAGGVGGAGERRGGSRARRATEGPRREIRTGAFSGLWFSLAVAIAAIAGGYAAALGASAARDVTIGTLVAAAALGSLPWGPWSAHRVVAAPAFAAAAAFAIAWDPAPERLPTVIGIAALAAAICAAVARALDVRAEEGLRVWVIVGVGLFVITTGAALARIDAQVVWAVVLVAAMLAARFVPQLAIEVPDQYLLDLERLAVTAWSARERPSGRRGRTVVPRQAVEDVAQSGARLITAAGVAVMLLAAVAAALLLREATASVDVIGARCQVGFSGGALLLAARSYRHVGARAALRAGGLACWVVLAVVLFTRAEAGLATAAAVVPVVLGCLVVLVAVALGRGWRSAWWSRRAEVAESLCAAFGVGSVVVAAGLTTTLWN